MNGLLGKKIEANCAILNVDKGFSCSTYYVVPIIFVSNLLAGEVTF